MKKISLILILLLFITTGCLNYTELNDIGIINTIGIDKDNNEYIIDINMLTPTVDNLEDNKTYQVKSNNINDAFDKLYLITSKNINLSHLELLVFSSNIEKNDYKEIITFILNRDDVRNTFNVILLNNYNNDNIFKYDSKEINSLIETNSKEDGIVYPKEFGEIIEDILNYEISYIPTISIEDNIKIIGYSSIYKENKLLSLRESISYNFITNKIIKCNLVDENLNIKVDKSITSISVKDNNITININSTLTDYGSKENIEKKYNETLKQYIEEFINNNDQEYFYSIIEKKNYKYYKDNKPFNIKYIINIESKLNKEVVDDKRKDF